MNRYRFGDFEIDPGLRRIFQLGSEIELNARSFDVLLFLLEQRPRVVSKDEIIENVWNGVVVEDNSVERAIVSIRKSLGDSAASPKLVGTVRGKGYHFVGNVVVADEASTETVTRHAQSRLQSFRRPMFTLFAGLAIGFVLISMTGSRLYDSLTNRTLLADDFSGETGISDRWTISGESVRVSDGTVTIVVGEIDGGGEMISAPIAIDRSKPLVVQARLKVAFNKSVESNINFVSAFGLLLEPSSDQRFLGLHYANAEGEFCYPGQISEIKGFYSIRDSGDVRVNKHHTDGLIGPRIEPIWDEWFDQTMIFDLVAGSMEVRINGQKKSEFLMGDIGADSVRLLIRPRGWWLHHKIEVDKLSVTQARF